MCGVKEIELKKLALPFHPSFINWRLGATSGDKTKGLALPYIDVRAVRQRLNDVCGIANWRNEYKPSPIGGILCGIFIQVLEEDGATEWVGKWDGADQTNEESVKGGISDSFKRAGAVWTIGEYLYALPKFWVEIEPSGRSHKIKNGHIPTLPPEALPADFRPEKKGNGKQTSRSTHPVKEPAVFLESKTDEGPKGPKDWGPISNFVDGCDDISGQDVARIRKEVGDDAQLVWAHFMGVKLTAR